MAVPNYEGVILRTLSCTHAHNHFPSSAGTSHRNSRVWRGHAGRTDRTAVHGPPDAERRQGRPGHARSDEEGCGEGKPSMERERRGRRRACGASGQPPFFKFSAPFPAARRHRRHPGAQPCIAAPCDDRVNRTSDISAGRRRVVWQHRPSPCPAARLCGPRAARCAAAGSAQAYMCSASVRGAANPGTRSRAGACPDPQRQLVGPCTARRARSAGACGSRVGRALVRPASRGAGVCARGVAEPGAANLGLAAALPSRARPPPRPFSSAHPPPPPPSLDLYRYRARCRGRHRAHRDRALACVAHRPVWLPGDRPRSARLRPGHRRPGRVGRARECGDRVFLVREEEERRE